MSEIEKDNNIVISEVTENSEYLPSGIDLNDTENKTDVDADVEIEEKTEFSSEDLAFEEASSQNTIVTEENINQQEPDVLEEVGAEETESVPVTHSINEVLQKDDSPNNPESPLNKEELTRQIDNLQKEIEILKSELDKTDDELFNAQEKLERIQVVQEEFHDWVDKRRRSYAWKLQEKLKNYSQNLDADEKAIRDFSAEEPKFEFGFAEKTRKWFLRSFMRNLTITWLLVILIYILHTQVSKISNFILNSISNQNLQDFLNTLVLELFGPNFLKYIVYIFIFSLIHFIGLLFAYSRRNNEYAQHVAVESARTLAMEKGIYEVRDSRERLDSLYPQVPQVISVLSFGLHKPWVVRKESLMFSGSVPDGSAMPASVEISVPTISSKSPIYEELVAKTKNEIQITGWRYAAFERAIQDLSSSIGFGSNGLAIRELDEDQSRGGKRQLLLNIDNADSILEQIGDEKIDDLTAAIQEKILPTVKANVVSLKPDPLAELELTGSLLKESSENIAAWEVKLAEIAGIAAPWSSETFSAAGSSSGKHETLESVFMASDRVKDLAVSNVETHADVSPGSRPFEVAIRVDFSEWCKPYEVAIFEDFIPTNEEKRRWEQGIQNSESAEQIDITELPSGPVLL